MILVVAKLKRFGGAPTRDLDGRDYDNVAALRVELADLRASIDRVERTALEDVTPDHH